jgi:hypothetical protein
MSNANSNRSVSVASILDEDLMLERVCERDVDLLLLEELQCSVPFQRWVLECACPTLAAEQTARFRFAKVLHSVSSSQGDGAGETDIAVIYETEDQADRLAVLLENKIDARFPAGPSGTIPVPQECACHAAGVPHQLQRVDRTAGVPRYNERQRGVRCMPQL